MDSFELVAEGVGVGFINGEVGADFVLEAEFPFVGFGGVVLPEAAVGDGEGGVALAFGIDSLGEVAGGEVCPVVVFAAFGGAEFGPPGFGFVPLGVEEGPEGGAVDHDAVVEVHAVFGGDFGLGVAGLGGGGADFGALAHELDEVVEFGFELHQFGVALFGAGLGFGVALAFGAEQVGNFTVELGLFGHEVFGEEVGEGAVLPAVDGDEGDEVLFLGGEGEVDGPLLVHADVDVFEEVEPQPVAQGFAGGDRTAMFGPGGLQGLAGGMGEAVFAVGAIAAVGGEVEDAVGKTLTPGALTPIPSPGGRGGQEVWFPFSLGRRG